MIGITLPLVILSFLGYMLLARKVLMLRWEFIPVFVFSSISCAVFFFGLAGVLPEGSIVVMSAGVLAFVWFALAFRQEYIRLQIHITLFHCFFMTGSLLFFVVLIRSRLTHYDNFSHWGIVVKQMLSTHAFPTAESALVDFKNYPLGTASFLYYVCRFSGHSESTMLIAQAMLVFSCFYAMFGIISEKKRFLLYAFMSLGLAALSFFNLTIRINNLLVDFLLPIFTLAIFAAAYQYRKDPLRSLLFFTPVAGLLTVTKSTGIIFAAFGLMYMFYMLIKHREAPFWGRFAWLSPTALLGVFTPYLLWSLHMKTAFFGVVNKFDTQKLPIQKTAGQMNEIISLFWRSATDLTTRPAIGILGFNLLAIGASIFAARVMKKKWRLWKGLIALNAVLILYYTGILGLYLFSMPWDEASWLAGFERYASSIVVLFAGALVMCATVDIENTFHYRIGEVPDEQAFHSPASKSRYQKGVLACTALAIIMLLSEYNGMKWNINAYGASLPQQVQSVVGDRWVKDGEADTHRYLLYASDKDAQVTNYYMQYVGRYFLYAPAVDGICLFWEDNMDNLLSGYDYFVMVESDVNARHLLHKHYGVTGEEGLYRIDKTNGKISLVLE